MGLDHNFETYDNLETPLPAADWITDDNGRTDIAHHLQGNKVAILAIDGVGPSSIEQSAVAVRDLLAAALSTDDIGAADRIAPPPDSATASSTACMRASAS